MKFEITSKGIIDGLILDKYGKKSNDLINGVPQLSLPLQWSGHPPETVSFAIVFEDFENIKEEGFSWIHWLVANIPKDINILEEGFSRNPAEKISPVVQGKNTWITEFDPNMDICNRYGGPAPVRNSHEYEIRLYALDKALELNKGFYYCDLRKMMNGSILDEAVIYGKYGA